MKQDIQSEYKSENMKAIRFTANRFAFVHHDGMLWWKVNILVKKFYRVANTLTREIRERFKSDYIFSYNCYFKVKALYERKCKSHLSRRFPPHTTFTITALWNILFYKEWMLLRCISSVNNAVSVLLRCCASP